MGLFYWITKAINGVINKVNSEKIAKIVSFQQF